MDAACGASVHPADGRGRAWYHHLIIGPATGLVDRTSILCCSGAGRSTLMLSAVAAAPGFAKIKLLDGANARPRYLGATGRVSRHAIEFRYRLLRPHIAGPRMTD